MSGISLNNALGLGLTRTTGGGLPAGMTWTTFEGVQATYNGLPVFDDGAGSYFVWSA